MSDKLFIKGTLILTLTGLVSRLMGFFYRIFLSHTTSEFGDDISEDNKKYEWYFDSDTTNWQMYAFNLSGLYRFSDFGQKTSATRLSADGNFDSLADDVIYDVLVGANQELYLLVRRTNKSQIESETTYDSGVIKYVPANK